MLPEGSQIVEFHGAGHLTPPPVPMLGHVASSYRSAELGRPFALALVKAGRSRIGEHVHMPVNGTLMPVEITGPVLVDWKEAVAMASQLQRTQANYLADWIVDAAEELRTA